MRSVIISFVLAGCVQTSTGGGSSTAPTSASTSSIGTTGSTPTSPTGPAASTSPGAGPWTDIAPIIEITDASQNLSAVAGDFDGDGVGDLVVGSRALPGVFDVWYGPLVAGNDYSPGTSTTQILAGVIPLDSAVQNAGDVDDDGDDDLVCGGYLVPAPQRGAVEDASTVAFAGTGVWSFAVSAFGDLDGDGWQDVAFNYGQGVQVVYGPLAGSNLGYVLDPAGQVPPNQTWILLGSQVDVGAHGIEILPDVSGDGVADLRAGASPDAYVGNVGPHGVWSVAAARGVLLTDADALVTGLPVPSNPTGDVDGDGIPDFVTTNLSDQAGASRLYSLGEAVRSGVASPLATVADATLRGTPGDLDGDGREDLFGVGTGPLQLVPMVFPASGLVGGGLLDPGLVSTVAPSWSVGSIQRADVTGDGVIDLVVASGYSVSSSTIVVIDGASLYTP